MGANGSYAPATNGQSNGNKITDHITLSVRGSRKTGKTALITKIQAKKLYPDYSQTPVMTATDVMWNPVTCEGETIQITIWDVVDKAIRYLDVSQDQELPDATTVDTYSRADGIVILYNPKNPQSIKYAVTVINEAPPETPMIICCNFADEHLKSIGIPKELAELSDRFQHVHTSMTTNQGLGVVAKWLDLPLLYHRKKTYEDMLKHIQQDFSALDTDLKNNLQKENFIAEEETQHRKYTVPESSIIPPEKQAELKHPSKPMLFENPGS
ncbi:hypothetical protein TVAG_452380 [Trichomonas vaginalis G3]|uniref:Small GTP-binding protein n=1 Tax=Trichomonas vaginalis (strain ATCC PRA-98 / G3) TaxID=412133 RepID=A2DJW0_TRIV3|nr:Ras GTPase-related family [Trichomonas vaginalis G3]EAY19324.1 hypothetical protein TVAG_452380 [Trichomonas vaginalis G3]KAI5527224.1 Ras GTPase-related family [Trichomonas vaginalis G3]|eukprot:XP_001580310.1 hypothetical protein [Trichomonas vaginalis G3]